ncbi:MAG: NAD(+) synthase, partial [Sediminibacterium sp.]|nr:NAD(+) synthase [Sediminibacterium sp.]
LKILDIAKNPNYNIKHIFEALVLGVRDYFKKMNFKKAIIGSSGGIDSAVTIAIAVQALGNENVETVLMPSMYSSTSSVEDAILLSKNLNINYSIVAIEKIYHAFLQELSPLFGNLPFSLAEENLQSRIRGNILMSLANKFGYILLNTSNKSELAMGYGTLYGDMAGGLSVLGDCYKLQVYALANYINNSAEIIPINIISKAPSAELRPNQKDSDSLPDYVILDSILYQWIDQNKTMEDIIKSGIPTETVRFVIDGFSKQEFKRQQFCPILRVSTKAFGEGRKIPIVAKYG